MNFAALFKALFAELRYVPVNAEAICSVTRTVIVVQL